MKSWDDCSSAERIERWENVLRVLRALTPHQRREHFDMSIWGKETPCGTVACAAGHCGLDPWFRRRGFKLHFFNPRKMSGAIINIDNSREFFGNEGTDNIFLGDENTVPAVIKQVRQHIEQLKKDADD